MSIPGDQSNPYAHPQQPQPGAGAPPGVGGQPGAGGPGATNQTGVYGPGGTAGATSAPELTGQFPGQQTTGHPVPGAAVGPSPTMGGGFVQPGGPTGPAGTGGQKARVPGWVWGVGGAVMASAIWGAAVIVNGGFHSEPSADLGGYHFHHELCEVMDTSAFTEHYTYAEGSAQASRHSAQKAQDVSSCGLQFKPRAEDDYDDGYDDGYDDYRAPDTSPYVPTVYVDFKTIWHKQTDPSTEFESEVKGEHDLRDRGDKAKYDIVEIEELGEEAFYSTETSEKGPLTSATLSIRDGWVTAELRWSTFLDRRDDEHLGADEVKQILLDTAKTSLAELRKQEPENQSPGPDDSSGPDEPDSDNGASDPPKRGDGDI
ncbi:hypothetical protein MTQ01_07685 [Streptomyces sp. XM4193]|uniref:hypothetical protein n=1 Tax=Streptomyces sp. XM4193 TaxID=2929782 RepID=UPI001FFAA1A7|nr:hypothetical protein [Streptomyces sp. XM4193]MCK1795884.1 hypothetical protein [Streptomyces sp. XM4193]